MHIKRYWLLVVIIPFCIIAVGSYYVSSTGNQTKDYVLKTIKGQESEAKGLQVQGEIDRKPIQISTNGSESPIDQESYWDMLDQKGYYLDQMNKLYKENRAFIRGKSDVSAFYEDEKILAYVGANHPKDSSEVQPELLAISVLRKEEKTNKTFEISADKKNDEYFYIKDVQVKDQLMKVLVNRKQRNNGLNPEFMPAGYDVYTIDLLGQKLLSSERIMEETTKENGTLTSNAYIYPENWLGPDDYAIFDRRVNQIYDSKESDAEQNDRALVNRELLVYDVWQGQWKTLQSEAFHNLLIELQGTGETIRYSGHELSLIGISDQRESRVMRINVADNKVINDVRLSLQTIQQERGRASFNQLDKDRLYLLMMPTVAIIDLQSGKVLYQGEVQRKDQPGIGALSLFGIKIQK